jgi:membrane-associated protein
MTELIETLKHLIDPEFLIQYGGLGLLIFIIFAETGLLIGFFFPGDSLLFIAGLMCGTPYLETNIYALISLLCISAIVGNTIGYLFGKKVGEALYDKPDSLFFKKKYITMTQDFYAKHGAKAVIFGRFAPFIRTFAPILAGTASIDFKKFTLYNIIGALLWVPSFLLAGFLLGKSFPQVKDYLHYITAGIILLSLIPVIITFIKERKAGQNK